MKPRNAVAVIFFASLAVVHSALSEPSLQAGESPPAPANAHPVRVLVWDERQPAQRKVYPEYLGGAIAAHLAKNEALRARTAGLDDPEQGLPPGILDEIDVLIWWGHVRHDAVPLEKAQEIVERVREGKLGLVVLHSAHWSLPFMLAMEAKAVQDALERLPGSERAKARVRFLGERVRKVPPRTKRNVLRTLYRRLPDGTIEIELERPHCVFPRCCDPAEPSLVRVLLPDHPIAEGVPEKFEIPRTEMYDAPFGVPEPDLLVLEESWKDGEHFPSGALWHIGRGDVFYFRPGHETYDVYRQPHPLKIVENAALWLGRRVRERKGTAAARPDAAGTWRWPAWRGPRGDGFAGEGTFPIRWSAQEGVVWRVELPGKGCSTPTVWDGHIFVTCPAGGEDAVLDFDLDGRRRWIAKVGKARPGKHRNGSGANPSPVTDGRAVFAYFRSGNLAAVDFEGGVRWRTNLQERFGPDTLWWDIGTSPVLADRYVIVAVVQEGDAYVAAFERESGRLGWRIPRRYECALEGDHAYTTPLVARDGDRELVIVWGAEHLTAYDARDGSLVWACGDFNPEKRSNWVAVSSAVIAGDTAVVPYGRGGLLFGVRLGGRGDVTATHRAWRLEDAGSFVPTPAARDGVAYVLRDRGELLAVDAEKGRIVRRGALPRHRAKYYASPLIAGDLLYAAREDGTIFTVRIDGGFEVLAENNLGERVIASPVPIPGGLILRSERSLWRIAAPEGG